MKKSRQFIITVSVRKAYNKVSAEEKASQPKMKDKFKHHWLTDKDIAQSSQTGL